MYQRIVAAVDGSDNSIRAAKQAITLAETFGGSIWLVHAFPHTSDLLGYPEFDRLVSRRKSAGQKVLNSVIQALGDTRIEITEDLLEAPEAEAILAVAASRHADLIVLGTRGLGSIEGLLFGSVSRKVVHHAPCSVLVVK